MSPALIALTTDFGPSGGYVGAMKGAALSINPDAVLVDISHDVPPRDIAHGAFVSASAYRYFPPDTVHVAVVDPGVGTSRLALLLVTPTGSFLAPDNGLLTYVLTDHLAEGTTALPEAPKGVGFLEPFSMPVPDSCSAYSLNNADYWRHPISGTFHGRDIFAPVAAQPLGRRRRARGWASPSKRSPA